MSKKIVFDQEECIGCRACVELAPRTSIIVALAITWGVEIIYIE